MRRPPSNSGQIILRPPLTAVVWVGRFSAALTAFTVDEPKPWVVCYFYREFSGFPRQRAQRAAFTLTPGLGRDHAEAIMELFKHDVSRSHLYIVPAELKRELKTTPSGEPRHLARITFP